MPRMMFISYSDQSVFMQSSVYLKLASTPDIGLKAASCVQERAKGVCTT